MARLHLPSTELIRKLLLGLSLLGCLLLVRFNLAGLVGVPAANLPTQFIFPGNDLVVYLQAGQAIRSGQSPYPNGLWGTTAVFHYSPVVAWLMSLPFGPDGANVPFRSLAYLQLGAILLAYGLAWFVWRAVFSQLALTGAVIAMQDWLPLWLVYSQWFADQNFLNTYTFLLLLDGLLLLTILRGQLLPAIMLAVLIAQTKPHYLYPLAVPLFLGQGRFLLKLVGGCLIGYGLVVVALAVAVGPVYTLALYRDYVIFLTTIAAHYPWAAYYLGYNHSWQSILHWLFGLRAWIPAVVMVLRVIMVLPLGWLIWRWWQQRKEVDAGRQVIVALGLALALHFWSLISLDQLWEVTTAIMVFYYLLATGSPSVRRFTLVLFGPFALIGLAQLIGWRVALWLDRPLDVFDLTARLPLIMVVGLGLYALLLWTVRAQFQPADASAAPTLALLRH